uniref:NADH-ubiquinone oxidoreductase chain 5 n=1 Tax=Ozobranchus jantseanus TaxID=1955321 RepID=A0A343D0L7_9ANNE|nr:NADH dehydrogenase subunit 5 [Ozobranchus jantseanus]ARR75356.1 NADH dehydrogenase subunit 5 [Ozobranchus jantseanus]
MKYYYNNIHKLAPNMLILMSLNMFLLAMYIMHKNCIYILEWEFFSILSSPLNLTIMLDPKGVLFSSVVLFISGNVMNFSKLYMAHDKFIDRFTYMVLLFVCSMNLLIFIPNLIVLLLGWDGLGIISFILVIYYQNSKSLAGGMITAMTNRIGDVMIILSIALTLNQGHWNINSMWFMEESNMQILFIMIAAMTKSAQMPFSSWLPAAMAAPTPVSALVHSSTLVTAGVFLLLRFYPFLHMTHWFNTYLLYIGVLTMTMAGICAMVENDMKKIIALSTLSQLGLMMTTLGLNLPMLCYFHMVAHAMFKALLFICAGVLINSHHHSQDLRWMGNLASQMPMTSSCIIISNLAMAGFPFLAAFYTKDPIIEMSLYNMNNFNVMLLLYLSLGITAFYSMRFMISVVWTPLNCSPYYKLEEPKNVTTPMMNLALPSILFGMILWWIYPQYSMSLMMDKFTMLMPMFIVFMSFAFSYLWCKFDLSMNMFSLNFLSTMWFLTPFSSQMFMKPYYKMSKNYLELVDQSWMEYMGGLGLFNYMNNASNKLNMMNSVSPIMFITISVTIFLALYNM